MHAMRFLVLFSLILAGCRQAAEPVVWSTIEKRLQTQLISLADGDTLDLPEGHYMFTRTLTMDGKHDVVIRGQGIGKTVLSFLNQAEGAQGIMVSHSKNVTLEDFSIEDAKGDNIKVTDTDGITFRRVSSIWTGEPRNENGAYALYPVLCKHVVIEESVAAGSSDAGIYVGQSDSVVIRNNKAYWNVAGIESENSRWVEISGNEAYDNTGGILVFDLPGLTQYGHTTRVVHNNVHDNNHKNFATKGNVVASIPPGTGFMLLATHDLEMTGNEITDNTTLGVGIISYELVASVTAGDAPQQSAGVQRIDNNYKTDTLYNPYPYRLHIHHNKIANSHWFPSTDQEIGKLLLAKSFMHPPDVVFDGIPDPGRTDREICVRENGDIVYMNIDAANGFANLTKDLTGVDCEGVHLP